MRKWTLLHFEHLCKKNNSFLSRTTWCAYAKHSLSIMDKLFCLRQKFRHKIFNVLLNPATEFYEAKESRSVEADWWARWECQSAVAPWATYSEQASEYVARGPGPRLLLRESVQASLGSRTMGKQVRSAHPENQTLYLRMHPRIISLHFFITYFSTLQHKIAEFEPLDLEWTMKFKKKLIQTEESCKKFALWKSHEIFITLVYLSSKFCSDYKGGYISVISSEKYKRVLCEDLAVASDVGVDDVVHEGRHRGDRERLSGLGGQEIHIVNGVVAGRRRDHHWVLREPQKKNATLLFLKEWEMKAESSEWESWCWQYSYISTNPQGGLDMITPHISWFLKIWKVISDAEKILDI